MSTKSLAAITAISTFVLFSLLPQLTAPQRGQRLQLGSMIAFPTRIGAYRLEHSWYHSYVHNLGEAGAVYKPERSTDDRVLMYLLVGEVQPHDAFACALSRGEQVFGRQISNVRASDASASFDVAYDRKENSLGLVAATECWSGGCSAGPPGGFGWYAPRLTFASLFFGAEKPLPVTIKIEAKRKDGSLDGLGDKLGQEFASFIHGLNLKDLEDIQRLQNQ